MDQIKKMFVRLSVYLMSVDVCHAPIDIKRHLNHLDHLSDYSLICVASNRVNESKPPLNLCWWKGERKLYWEPLPHAHEGGKLDALVLYEKRTGVVRDARRRKRSHFRAAAESADRSPKERREK